MNSKAVLNPIINYLVGKKDCSGYKLLSSYLSTIPLFEAMLKLSLKSFLIDKMKSYDNIPKIFKEFDWENHVQILKLYLMIVQLDDKCKVSLRFQSKFTKQLLPFMQYALSEFKSDVDNNLRSLVSKTIQYINSKEHMGLKVIFDEMKNEDDVLNQDDNSNIINEKDSPDIPKDMNKGKIEITENSENLITKESPEYSFFPRWLKIYVNKKYIDIVKKIDDNGNFIWEVKFNVENPKHSEDEIRSVLNSVPQR